ncbi:MAG: hypothetical protein PHQ36_10285, partial [Anaerolineales bacterium]|nr:hypothetical protein [Anaerolineales bacterium]
MNQQSLLFRRIITAAIALILTGQACTLSLFQNPLGNTSTAIPASVVPPATSQPAAQTTFTVVLPSPLPPNETLILTVLDEVTGLQMNATQYPMSARDSLTYAATLPLPYNSVVKYRYTRSGASQVSENTNLGAQIRYRMYYVAGPGEARDIIAHWGDESLTRQTGTILGTILNADTGSPLPNMLVAASGAQSITDSMGRFELFDLPIGTQNLLVYSLDGFYQPFQQGAVVAENPSTIVELRVKPAQQVSVTFSVAVPDNTVPGAPVRIAGNLLQLGDTFAD